MTRSNGTPLRRLARSLAIGTLAFGVSAAALPQLAAADHPGPRAIAEQIDRIAWQVDQIRDLRSPYRQDARIDRLQHRLDRLEAINDRERGRLARQNDDRIDRLQHRLARMEQRAERRIERTEDRASAYLGYGYDRYGAWDGWQGHKGTQR